jgi:lipopolysaccharide transport system permease protein
MTKAHAADDRGHGFARSETPAQRYWKGLATDFGGSLRHWQFWWLLGYNDVRHRYRRSRLGQFWITISMGAFIAVIGPVYAIIFKTDIREFLPYFTANFVAWGFIASMITDSCLVFVQSDGYIRQEPIPKTSFVLRVLVRNLLILGHNALLIPVVFAAFAILPSSVALLAIPGLLIAIINCFLLGLFLATICTRFRDFPQIVTNLVQVAFFLTPIFWQRKHLIDSHAFVIEFNPFASYLNVIASPLLGQVPPLYDYLVSVATTVLLCAIALPFFARFRSRIVYWL